MHPGLQCKTFYLKSKWEIFYKNIYLVESRRVLFLLPVALKNVQAIESLARNNAFPLITSTLASCEVQTNRGIIQNEALIALNIIMMLANR